jgi:hypothetical protein
MTLLIATVTKSAGWLSQDTMLTDFRGAREALQGMTEIVTAPVDPVETGEPLATRPFTFGDKLVLLPRLTMAIGCIGSHGALAMWCSIVAGNIFLRDILDLESTAEELWGGVPPAIKALPLLAVHVGYSNMAGRVIGFWADAARGFKPARLEPGHLCHPAPITSHSDYEALEAAWEPAACGQGVADFHVKMAENAHSAARRGLVQRASDGLAIGGQVQTARVDKGGIHIRVAHEFSDYQEQLAAFYDAHAEAAGHG